MLVCAGHPVRDSKKSATRQPSNLTVPREGLRALQEKRTPRRLDGGRSRMSLEAFYARRIVEVGSDRSDRTGWWP
ncbi:hypothetical protein DR64_8736 [Paraburkholderia xenovorans LB400]|nr:hypothetical protein DR64_8736 [Paraburkholderia xenovorans LB400]